MTKLTFCGGAGSVTGVNILLETDTHKLLLDCGLLQREMPDTEVNSAPFSYDPASINTLLVSHAHADHIGRIPKLVRDGFSGIIYSTPATRDLAAIMFEDALRITKANALYDKKDIEHALSLWRTHEYHDEFHVGDVTCSFLDAGHILGSAMVQLTRNGKKLLFTGDLGNSPEPLLPDTESIAGTHILIMESVYGDRLHEEHSMRREHLRDAIEETRARKGTLLIPAFSIERTQILLHEINDMVEHCVIDPTPVYLDSPLAIRVTEIFKRYAKNFNDEIRSHYDTGDDPFAFERLTLTPKVADSHAIHEAPDPKIIIAGSGMSSGGRIRAHETRYLGERNAHILFVGYQAPGSLGRRLVDGAREVVIDGARVTVRARVSALSGYSGHKDRDALVDFVAEGEATLEKIFVAMGEPKASLFLSQRLRDFLGVDAVVPETNIPYELVW